MLQNIFLGDFFSINGRSQEFLEIDSPTPIYIYTSYYVIYVSDISLQAEFLSEYVNALFELFLCDSTVSVIVKKRKNLSYLEFLFTRYKLRSYILEDGRM